MNKPQIRFKGFNEEWHNKKVGNILSIGNGCDYKHLQSGNIPVFGTGGLMTYVNDYLHDGETVFIGRKGTIDKPAYFSGKFWTVDTLFYTHSFKNSLPLYVFPLFQTIDWYLYNAATGVPSLSKDTILDIDVTVSTDIKEQKQIGNYFKQIDEMIVEVEREISRLEKMKQASLQKMFPRPGQTTPKIRFAGFSEPWTEKKISDCASFSRGQGYTKADLRETGTPIFLYGRLYTQYSPYVESVDTFSFPTPFSVYSDGNEVVMPSSGETAEDIAVASAILTKGIILAGGLNIIIPKNGIDSVFLALSLTYSQAHFELAKKAQGKSVVHIYNQDIADLNILFPSLMEQKAIGEYFRNLDSLLAAKRQKLVKLRNIKQACLDKMFVNAEDL